MNGKKVFEALSKSTLFKGVADDEIDDVISNSTLKEYEKGEMVFCESDKPKGLLLPGGAATELPPPSRPR